MRTGRKPSAAHIAAMNDARAKARERRAAEKASRQAQGIEVPRWVPEDGRDLYLRLALNHDEFLAARVLRAYVHQRKGRKPAGANVSGAASRTALDDAAHEGAAASPPLRDGPADLLRVRACGEVRTVEGNQQ